MKKLSLFAVASMIAVGAFAASNEVTSVNAVGFIRTTVASGGWELISLPFENLDGDATATIAEILPDAPDGTRAWYYIDGAWEAETKVAFLGWDPGTNEFIRSDALFVNVPASGGPVELTIMGEVPDANTATESTVILGSGWTLMGYAYPSDIALLDSSLNVTANDGDRLWWWNPADGGAWEATTRVAFLGWDPSDITLEAGRGYFYDSQSTFDWIETKPYVWP